MFRGDFTYAAAYVKPKKLVRRTSFLYLCLYTSVDIIWVMSSEERQQIDVLVFGGELSVFFEITVKLLSRRLSEHSGLNNSPMLKFKYKYNHIINGPKENPTA